MHCLRVKTHSLFINSLRPFLTWIFRAFKFEGAVCSRLFLPGFSSEKFDLSKKINVGTCNYKFVFSSAKIEAKFLTTLPEFRSLNLVK